MSFIQFEQLKTPFSQPASADGDDDSQSVQDVVDRESLRKDVHPEHKNHLMASDGGHAQPLMMYLNYSSNKTNSSLFSQK
jgi:hypothetical protein